MFYFRGPGTELGGDDEPMISLFVRDIEEGIQGTGIKAGILKCATDEPGITHDVERVLRAVAAAHRRTGVPISTHTHAATERGLDQQTIFEEEGVDLTRVIIGHCGDSTDPDYLEKLVSKGSLIGMDRFGIDVQLPFEDRVNIVAEMCKRGHANKMVLSHDASVLHRLAAAGGDPGRAAELALPAHPRGRAAGAARARRLRRGHRQDAGAEPARVLLAAGRPTEAG